AGGGCHNFVDFVRLGYSFELGERLERCCEGRWRQTLAVQAAGAQADHVFFAVDDLERQVRTDLDNYHVNGIRADVDRSDAHAEGGWGPVRPCRFAPLHSRYILPKPAELRTLIHRSAGPNPTMNRAKPRVTKVLLGRRARALRHHLKAAVDGDGTGVHQARVASRRLREAVPVLATGVKGARAGRIRRKVRRV